MTTRCDVVVDDLGSVDTTGRAGAVWSLPHGGDLDANLVHLHPGDVIDQHVNAEVDVAVFVLSGRAELTVDGVGRPLGPDTFALIPKGAARSVRAGAPGVTYLSIHRGRGPLDISTRAGSRS
jgi:quercetin dioxygenase-like cupin family protein